MNQERFDELARALATTQVSRGQVLKTLAASAVLGIFSSFVGESAEARRCKREGRTCSGNRQCCTKNCIDGVCECKTTGSICGSNRQCCSGVCSEGGFCSCKHLGQTCTADKNCCDSASGDACQGGKCCRKPGFGCAANAECCTGNCCNGFCCAPNQTCQNGECVCDELYEPCGLGCCNPLTQECRNGTCCKLENVQCSGDSECCSGECCRGVCCADGEVCKDGRCKKLPCGTSLAGCASGDKCCPGTAGRQNGQCCQSDWVCCMTDPSTGEGGCCPPELRCINDGIVVFCGR